MDSTAWNKAEISKHFVIVFEFAADEYEGIIRELQAIFMKNVLFEGCQSLVRFDGYALHIRRSELQPIVNRQ